MKVLSLFDGISCGMVALQKAGIPVERYVAYEIEPNAIKVSKRNYPQIEHCGDVTTADFSQYEGFDLLIGGSPCQSLSIVQSKTRQNLNGKSKLFFEFVRALEEVKPKHFLFENVASMNEESKQVISELLGCQPIFIDSADFSAQERPRYYWTNIPVAMNYEKSKLVLQDILEPHVDEKYFYSYPLTEIDMNKQVCATMQYNNHEMHKRIFNPKFKVHTLTTCAGGNLQKKVLVNGRARKLTALEYERLQTLPDGYTEGIADTHRYNALGNGWTVDVIAHILKGIKEERENEQMGTEMELKIGEMQLPEKVSFNYEELKQELTAKVSMYETLVYSDDQIKQAKADKASLNKLKKSLNDERIKREREYMVPFNEFKAQVNEIIGIIDKPIAIIDKQVKEYEEAQKAEKKEEITAIFNLLGAPAELNFDKMFDPKWLNASTTMASIRADIEFMIANFNANIQILSDLPEFAFEAKQTYISTLNLQDALNEAHRLSEMAKLKAAAEQVTEVVEEVAIATEASDEDFLPFTDEESTWSYYQIKLTPSQMSGMESYFAANGIEFKKI